MQLSDRVVRRRVLSLTPLIDVVFLLLVFFMLASSFLKFGTVTIDTAGAGAGKADIEKLALVHIGPEGQYRVGGEPVAREGLSAALDSAIAQGRTDAVIVLQKDAKVADLIDGLIRVRRHWFTTVRVVD